jgi:predicted  nucleic acid-binding Zn-ribbon protein
MIASTQVFRETSNCLFVAVDSNPMASAINLDDDIAGFAQQQSQLRSRLEELRSRAHEMHAESTRGQEAAIAERHASDARQRAVTASLRELAAHLKATQSRVVRLAALLPALSANASDATAQL